MAEGRYTLTVDAADILDQHGVAGTGSVSTSWLTDTERPSSSVQPLAKQAGSLVFPVDVTGTDYGNPPSGIASYDIYVSTNGSPWSFWTSVSASGGPAMYPGQSNTTYAFYSTATDQAGNTQVNSPRIEASTYVRDFTPPVTTVDGLTGANPTLINTATGTFTLQADRHRRRRQRTGLLPGVCVRRRRAYTEIGPYAVPAGAPNADGTYSSSVTFQGITDGQHHSYSFYSIGLDNASNLQTAPSSPNLIVASQVFSEPSQLAGHRLDGRTRQHEPIIRPLPRPAFQ